MKIGLLTVHCSSNFGASLQAYALKNFLEERGNTVEILNYRFSGFLYAKDYSENLRLSMNSRLKLLLFREKCNIRYKKFQEFEKECLGINEVELKKIEDGDYDIFVVGSDQVWNPSHINFDETFYFCGVRNKTRISYAASLGKDRFDDTEKQYLKDAISHMSAISVREPDSIPLLTSLGCSKEINYHVDPVFLLNSSKWRALEQNPKTEFRDYILVYVLGKNSIINQTVRSLRNKFKKEIVCIQSDLRNKYGDHNLYDIGPREFLHLVDNAYMVVTNSFHGVSFSYLFEKKVIILKSEKLNLRIDNLIKLFSPDCAQLTKVEDIESVINDVEKTLVDHTSQKEVIKKEIARSEKYFTKFSI